MRNHYILGVRSPGELADQTEYFHSARHAQNVACRIARTMREEGYYVTGNARQGYRVWTSRNEQKARLYKLIMWDGPIVQDCLPHYECELSY